MRPYSQLPPYNAQWGEDSWLADTMAIPNRGVFVDVGAGDGVCGSNTLYLENRGWTGLAIDADPRNADALRHRRCVVRSCAVATTSGPQPFGQHMHKSWSGLTQRGPNVDVITVDCFSLQDLLNPLGFQTVDLLSIDVEGTELDVWDSIDHTTTTCRLVIIEFDDRHPERTRERIHRHLGRDIYDLIHQTPANLIFERKDSRWTRRTP